MVNHYWWDILVAPTTVGFAAICLFALPVAFWELGQWRIGFLGKPLPWWVPLRIAAPAFFAVCLYVAAVLIFGVSMTHLKLTSTIAARFYYLFELLVAWGIATAAYNVVHRLLRLPFFFPSGGTFNEPNIPWTADALDSASHSVSGHHH